MKVIEDKPDRSGEYPIWYWLTTNGLKWLGRQLNIVIKEDGKGN